MEKAFDFINRKLLWPILLKNGIKGKLYRCIKSMYNSVKVRVRCGSKLTDYIKCGLGVKQGGVFILSLINELALEVLQNGRHIASFINDYFELFILSSANDVLLLSETIFGFQTQSNSLQRAASSLQLKGGFLFVCLFVCFVLYFEREGGLFLYSSTAHFY